MKKEEIDGLLKETKPQEGRVALTPKHVAKIIEEKTKQNPGYMFVVETTAGEKAGFPDETYHEVGAHTATRDIIYKRARSLTKVKEPTPEECEKLRDGQIINGFFHIPNTPHLVSVIKQKNLLVIPYENIVESNGSRPALARMSVIAADVALDIIIPQHLKKLGLLLSDVKVLILGHRGNAGWRAYDRLLKQTKNQENIIGLDKTDHGKFMGVPISELVKQQHVIICAAASPGEGAPVLITDEMSKTMMPGTIIVDISSDEKGNFWPLPEEIQSHKFTHDNPIAVTKNGVHVCAVTNLPGIVQRTSSKELADAILPYIKKIIMNPSIVETDPVLKNAVALTRKQLERF